MKCKLVNENFRSNYVDELLYARGVNQEDLKLFYNPTPELLQEPEALDNIEKGANKFKIELDLGKNMVIVVDSDVDGFTSSAIIYQYIKHINPDIHIDYVLHEGKGHGLSDTVDKILNSKTHYNVVILPDSSTNDKKYHEQLKEYGAWCLIMDHHLSESDDYSDNAIIINNQLSNNYRNKDLCGAGVTWQFCRVLDKLYNDNFAETLIDLAALGIVSDMMSVLSLENRYIINEGFNNIKNYFFQCLCDKQSYSMGGKVNPMTVAFYITPLINAMIRVGTEEEKERCFEAFINGHKLVESHKRGAKGTMEEVAIESARECTNARARQNRILDKAIDELEIKIFKYDLLANKVLFIRLDTEDFPPELNGLCAMKLAAKYQRPTIVARLNSEGYDRGSSRGLNESELKSFKAFMDESGFFEYTAGHDNACGISIPNYNLEAFHNYANKALENIDFGENFYEVNFERAAAEKDIAQLIENLTSYEDIWGQHNNEAMIHITDLNITPDDVRIMGKNKDTIKIEKFGVAYMFFRCKDRIEEFNKYKDMKIDLVGRANMNEWMGSYTPQIFVSDFEINDGSLSF